MFRWFLQVLTRLSAINCLLMLGLFGGSCFFSVKPVYYEEDKRIAFEHIDRFHAHFNEADYDRIYELFSDKGRNWQTREQFAAALRSLRESTGNFKTYAVTKADVKPHRNGRIVHLVLSTEYERKRIVEEFDCVVDGRNVHFEFYGQPEI